MFPHGGFQGGEVEVLRGGSQGGEVELPRAGKLGVPRAGMLVNSSKSEVSRWGS